MTAVIIGGAGGYLLRSATEPAATTVTITKTVTVRAPAYTTGSTGSAYVHFDGRRAFYSGPTELTVGTRLTLHFTTAVDGGSVVISRLDPAPTWEKLTHDIATANSATEVMPLAYVESIATRDGDGAVVAAVTRSGLYSVWAGPLTAPGGPTVALAAMLRVTS